MSDDKNYPFGAAIHEMDVTAFLNMRNWLEDAITKAGAKVGGAGIGLGQADLEFMLDGGRFSVSIKPLPKSKL